MTVIHLNLNLSLTKKGNIDLNNQSPFNKKPNVAFVFQVKHVYEAAMAAGPIAERNQGILLCF